MWSLMFLCFHGGFRAYRKGHPWSILALVVINCGLFILTMFGNRLFGAHAAVYFSNLLFPIGVYVFFRNLQTRRISTWDRILLGVACSELFIGLTLWGSSYFLPSEAYASDNVNGLLHLLRPDAYDPGQYPEPGFKRAVNATMISFFYLQILLMPVVLITSYRSLTKAKYKVLEFFSDRTFRFYLWMQRLVVMIFISFILIGGLTLYAFRSGFDLSLFSLIYTLIGLAGVALGLLSYLGPKYLVLSGVFGEFLRDDRADTRLIHPLDSPKRKEQLRRIEHVMDADLAYQDPDLTLSKLADSLGMSSRHLSRIINESFSQSFSDFVNSYRVEEVNRNLTDPEYENYSVQGIGLEAGFSSKSSFYSSFKKSEQMTPNQFKEQRLRTLGHE